MENSHRISWLRRIRNAIAVIVAMALAVPTALDATPAAATGDVPGPVPQVRYVSNGPGTVTIEWDVPWTDGGSSITDYRIDVRRTGGVWQSMEDGVSTEARATITGLNAGADYDVRVAARNATGDGPATVLGAVTNLTVSNGDICAMTMNRTTWCSSRRPSDGSVTYFQYPFTDDASRTVVNDIVDSEGVCSLSRSAGVLCSSIWKNRHGDLGQGLIDGPIATFRVPGLPTSLVSIASTSHRNCALDTSRNLWCWGMWSGTRDILSPTVVKTGVVQFEGQCARLWDGTVSCLDANGEWRNGTGFPVIRELAQSDGRGPGRGCGITDSGAVICFDTIAGSFLEQPGWDDAIAVTSGSARCALMPDGAVACYSSNSNGELGNGTRTSGYGTANLPEPAISLASNIEVPFGGYPGNHYSYVCAVGVSGTVYCWGSTNTIFVTGLASSTIPLAIRYQPTAETVTPMATPLAVEGLRQVARATRSVTVEWNPLAASSQRPLDGYLVEFSVDDGATWDSQNVDRRTTQWTSPALPLGSTLLVRVTGINAAGVGQYSAHVSATTTQAPSRPGELREVSHTVNSAVVTWSPSSGDDEPVTGYELQWSSDGETWHDAAASARETTATLTGLPSGSAIEVRIRAINAAGQSAYSDTAVIATSGFGAQTVSVVDSFGDAVYGGRITWATSTGSFESARDYGLTVDGTVTFPVAPAGEVDVQLSNVVVGGGATVSWSTVAMFGQGRSPRIELPAEPSRSSHTVRVTLPNGLPVMGATVSVSSLEGRAEVDGAEFTTPSVVTEGVTNEFGEVTLSGYSDESTEVQVEYNDGVLIQRLDGLLGLGDAEFQFQEMPWIETPDVITEEDTTTLVSIPVVSSTPSATVSVKAPVAAPQKCAGKRLSARTGSDGRATLKVCASASGRFTITGKGAVSTGVVNIHLRDSAALAVRNMTAVSPKHGTIAVAWNAPAWNGGRSIAAYRVTLTKPDGTQITKRVTTNRASFAGVKGAKTYRVSVVPITSVGEGARVTRKVPAA